jgi:uncharacterized protein YndB with AHSA1/START domain
MASFRFERDVAAPPETVFGVLTDHVRYAELTPLRISRLERQGEPEPNGVGAVRVLGVAGPPLREEVIAYEPASRFSYKLLSGLPVRDHVGTVGLTPQDGGTKVVYAIRTTPTVPLAGFAILGVVKLGVSQLLAGIVRESERLAAANG